MSASLGMKHVRAVLGVLLWLAIPPVAILAALRNAFSAHVAIVCGILAIGGALGVFPLKTLGQAAAIAKGLLPWTAKGGG